MLRMLMVNGITLMTHLLMKLLIRIS